MVTGVKLEPYIVANASRGSKFQFQRIGYFTPDYDYTAEKPVFNRTIALKGYMGEGAEKELIWTKPKNTRQVSLRAIP